MQTFESGGALMVRPCVPLKDYATLFAIGLAMVAIPPLACVYLLLFA